MNLFRSPTFSAGNAAIFFLWGSALGALFFMAQFLQTGLSHGPLSAGLRLMPWGATTFIVPPFAGALINRFGERPFIVAGMSLHAAGMIWIALVAEPHLIYWRLVAPLILSGTGVAMFLACDPERRVTSVAPQQIGKASGAYSTIRQLGGAFGVAVLVAAFAGTGSYVSAQTFSAGFATAMGASAALSLAGTIAGLALRGRSSATDIAPTRAVPAIKIEGGGA